MRQMHFKLLILFIFYSIAHSERAVADTAICNSALRSISNLSSKFESAVTTRRQSHPLPRIDFSDLGQSLILSTSAFVEQCKARGDGSSFDHTVLAIGERLVKFAQYYESSQENKNPVVDRTFKDLKISNNRIKIAVLDTGIMRGENAQSYELNLAGQKINTLHPLTSETMWDLGDGDNNPFGVHPHGTMVIQEALETLKEFVKRGMIDNEAQVPVFLPFKRWNHLEDVQSMYRHAPAFLRLEVFDTEAVDLVDVLKKTNPKIINMSGAFDDFSVTKYESLRKYLIENPQVILVNAAGNQKQDIDHPKFKYPWPSKFVDANGKRLSNIVNVTTNIGTTTGFNWGRTFVDIAIDARSTSFSAPKISALLAIIASEFPDCLIRNAPREVLKKLSTSSTNDHAIPILSLERDVTREAIQRACAM